MNEQILGLSLECAARAEEYADVEYAKRQTGYCRQDFFNYKLVELAVKECIHGFKERIATRYQGSEKDRDIAYGMEIVYLDIIDKFGIEE